VKVVGTYVLAAAGTIALGTGVAWPLLDSAGRRGLVEAAVVALVVQVAAFALLVRARARPTGFLAAFVGGMLARLVVVGAAGFVALGFAERSRTVALVLGLVSFLFVLVLLEAWFLADRKNRNEQTS
jgi:hypothetical protein